MIIDELIKKRNEKITEHENRFTDVAEGNITFEMFEKKYTSTSPPIQRWT